jgi:hypothetical protein
VIRPLTPQGSPKTPGWDNLKMAKILPLHCLDPLAQKTTPRKAFPEEFSRQNLAAQPSDPLGGGKNFVTPSDPPARRERRLEEGTPFLTLREQNPTPTQLRGRSRSRVNRSDGTQNADVSHHRGSLLKLHRAVSVSCFHHPQHRCRGLC